MASQRKNRAEALRTLAVVDYAVKANRKARAEGEAQAKAGDKKCAVRRP
jgi:hypothetical protein